MVGVAGRSRACATCKSRHIRCDERHPACYRCEKAGYTCQGYDRPLIFINGAPKKTNSNSAAFSVSRAERHNSTVAVSTSINTISSPQIQGSSFQQAETFIHELLLAQGIRTNLHRGDSPDAKHNLLHISTEAAKLLLQGHLSNQTQTVRKAIELSSMALQQLQSMLTRPHHDLSLTNDVPLLAIIMNMTVFELVAATTRDSWKHHVRGLAALIESYGPATFQEPSMRPIFGQARAHIMILHMEEKRRTFLEQPCWQKVPWDTEPDSKSLTAYYMDIICCIPGLLEDQQRLSEVHENPTTTTDTCDPQADELRLSMRARITSLYAKLLDTRWRWELKHPNCCHAVPFVGRTRASQSQYCEIPLPVNGETGQPIFNTMLSFDDLYRAVETNFYHSCLLILRSLAKSLDVMQELKRLHTPPSVLTRPNTSAVGPGISRDADRSRSCDITHRFSFKTNVPLLLPHETQSDHDTVHKICRTVEFLLHPSHGHAGALFLIFPLRVAQVYSKRAPLERAGTHIVSSRFRNDQKGFNVAQEGAAQALYNEQMKSNKKSETEIRMSLAVWMQKIMRHLGDVYGFGVARAYT